MSKLSRAIFCFLLAGVLAAGLLACGKKGKESDASADVKKQAAADPAQAEYTVENLSMTAGEPVRKDSPVNAVECSSVMDVTCRASGIAAMEDGSLLITDLYNKVVWKVQDGECTVYAGGETVLDLYGEPLGGYNDANWPKSYFSSPWAIAPFLGGFAVSDADNNAVRLILPGKVQTVNGKTKENLKISKNGVVFDHPTGLAADGDGNLYVSDTHNGAVRVISNEGTVSTVADGLGEPTGLCWKDGALYIAETEANRILKCADGKVEILAGSGEHAYIDGDADEAAFSYPQGLTVGDDGTVYVADTGNSAVRVIRDGSVTTLISRDRNRLEIDPISPAGLLIQGDELYICDSFTRKVLRVTLD